MTDLSALGEVVRLVIAGRSGTATIPPVGAGDAAERLLRAAGDGLLLPALAPVRHLLPEPHAGIVEAAALLNAERNMSLLAQLEEVGCRLNAAGVLPCVVKGACHLATGLWGDTGARLLGDLDLVVPRGTLERSRAALAGIAAEIEAEAVPPEVDAVQKHGPALGSERWPAVVELHAGLLGQRDDDLLPTDGLLARATPVRVGAAEILLPSPTDQAMIAVVHGPVGHDSYFAPSVIARDLVDLALLRHRHGRAIEWGAIGARLAQARWAGVAAITNRLVAEFCAEPGPFPVTGRAARLDAWRWRRQLDHPALIRLGRLAARSRYLWWMMGLGSGARRHYLAKLGRRATYRNAWVNYAAGAPDGGRQK